MSVGEGITPTPLLGETAVGWLQRIQALAQSGEQLGTATGIRGLDALGPILYPGDLTILAARPAMGKTSLAQQIGEHAARERSVLFFSLEMSAEDLLRRAITQRTGIPMSCLRQPRELTKRDWRAIEGVLTRGYDEDGIGGLSLLICEQGRNISQIESVARQVAGGLDSRDLPGLGLVILDYIQLLDTGTTTTNRAEAVGQISRKLKLLARELSVPFLVLAQLNRNLEHRVDRRPMLSDLRDSGAIEQDADAVLFIHREHVYDPEAPQDEAEVIIGKNRHGPLAVLPMQWDPRRARFLDIVDALVEETVSDDALEKLFSEVRGHA